MTKNARRVFAAISAVGAMIIAAAWTLIAVDAFIPRIFSRLLLGVPVLQAGGPRPEPYDSSAHVFYWILISSLLLAMGGTIAMLVLLPLSKFRSRGTIYIAILAIVLPFSFYNYSQGDKVLRASVQVCLDLALIFLTATIALWLNSVKAADLDVKVANGLSVSLLIFSGALVPAFFTFIWFLVAVSAITKDQSKNITWAHITSISGVASAAIAWLNYRKDRREKSKALRRAAG